MVKCLGKSNNVRRHAVNFGHETFFLHLYRDCSAISVGLPESLGFEVSAGWGHSPLQGSGFWVAENGNHPSYFVQASDMSVQCDELRGCQESRRWRFRILLDRKLVGPGYGLEGSRPFVLRCRHWASGIELPGLGTKPCVPSLCQEGSRSGD